MFFQHQAYDVLPFLDVGWQEYHRLGWAPYSDPTARPNAITVTEIVVMPRRPKLLPIEKQLLEVYEVWLMPDLRFISHLPRLKLLLINDTGLTDHCTMHLANQKQLATLDITNTKISESGAKFLAKTLGATNVMRNGTRVLATE